MDISNLAIIRSADSKIPTSEVNTSDVAKGETTPEKQTPIDAKFLDKTTITADKQLQATVLAKQDNGKYLLELTNGKKLELPLPVEAKVMDKIFLQIKNSQVTTVQIKDVAQSLNLNNNALLKLINNLQKQTTTENLINNKLPLIHADKGAEQPILKAPIINNLSLNITPAKADNSSILQFLKASEAPKTFNLQNQTVEITANNKLVNQPIEKIEFPQNTIKPLVQALHANRPVSQLTSFDVKVVQQNTPKELQVAVKQGLDLNLTLSKPETVTNNIISLKPMVIPQTQQVKLVKLDTTNIVQSIKVEPQVLKQIIEPLKTQIAQEIPKVNNLNSILPAIIKDNKIILPTVNNLTLKLPIKTETILPQAPKTELALPIKAEVSFVQNNNRTELVLKANNQLVKLDNLELELSNKQVNTAITNMLQSSNVINNTANTVTLKSTDFFEIILNVKNNLSDTKNLSFNIQADNKLHLVYPEKTVENPILQAKQSIMQEALPHLAKQFAPQLTFMLATAIAANKQTATADKDSDIFTLLLDSMPEQYKPKLQISQQNDGWKFFNFPYYQEDNMSKNGQAFYSNNKDKDGSRQTNLAIKVNFSNIGDVMVKFKLIEKSININIYTQIDIKAEEKQYLINKIQQKIADSGFSGTVDLKKQKTIEIPLLNSEKIVYSGINLKA